MSSNDPMNGATTANLPPQLMNAIEMRVAQWIQQNEGAVDVPVPQNQQNHGDQVSDDDTDTSGFSENSTLPLDEDIQLIEMDLDDYQGLRVRLHLTSLKPGGGSSPSGSGGSVESIDVSNSDDDGKGIGWDWLELLPYVGTAKCFYDTVGILKTPEASGAHKIAKVSETLVSLGLDIFALPMLKNGLKALIAPSKMGVKQLAKMGTWVILKHTVPKLTSTMGLLLVRLIIVKGTLIGVYLSAKELERILQENEEAQCRF